MKKPSPQIRILDQMLTNDDEVCIPSHSCILLAVSKIVKFKSSISNLQFLIENRFQKGQLIFDIENKTCHENQNGLWHKMAWGIFRDISAFYEAIFLKFHFSG